MTGEEILKLKRQAVICGSLSMVSLLATVVLLVIARSQDSRGFLAFSILAAVATIYLVMEATAAKATLDAWERSRYDKWSTKDRA